MSCFVRRGPRWRRAAATAGRSDAAPAASHFSPAPARVWPPSPRLPDRRAPNRCGSGPNERARMRIEAQGLVERNARLRSTRSHAGSSDPAGRGPAPRWSSWSRVGGVAGAGAQRHRTFEDLARHPAHGRAMRVRIFLRVDRVDQDACEHPRRGTTWSDRFAWDDSVSFAPRLRARFDAGQFRYTAPRQQQCGSFPWAIRLSIS